MLKGGHEDSNSIDGSGHDLKKPINHYTSQPSRKYFKFFESILQFENVAVPKRKSEEEFVVEKSQYRQCEF